MIAIALALAAAQAVPADSAKSMECEALVKTDARQALSTANAWRIGGGGLAARDCIGLAYVALERWAPAAETFEQAARQASPGAQQAGFWAKAGNAWLAGDEAEKARKAFDAALAAGGLTAELEGEVRLDRARAGVALEDLTEARSDVNKGLALVPADPFAWYLSAALALKEGNMAKANADMAKAVELAPQEADILLQAGTIAGSSGDTEAARRFYERAAAAAPNSDAGRAAKASLAE